MKITIPSAVRMHQILKEAETKIFLETGLQIDLRITQAEMSMNVPSIASAVATALDVPLADLVAETRLESARIARQIAMYLCKKYLKDLSHRYIGDKFNRDRTTVIHSIDVVNNMIITGDKVYNEKLKIAEQAVIALYNETKNNHHTA